MKSTTDQTSKTHATTDNFWENSDWEASDRHLKKISSMPFKREFPFIPTKQGLYIIRGPRQIGKSSWLKTVLSHYAGKESCYYLSCENITNHKELAEILKSLRGTRIILLDEISFVDEWDRAIKHEVDSGFHHIIMLTGSHAYDLKRGSDLMPGRFDAGGEFNLLPMLFDEFLEMRKMAGWHSGERVHELEIYFKVGGFPDSVAEAGKQGKTIKKSIETYWKWLKGDVIKLGKQVSYLQEILIQVSLCLQTPLSYQTLAKKTSIGSHNTVKEYIQILESCFALKELNAINIESGTIHFKKNKKFYFTDPLLYHLALELSGKESTNYKEKMAEQVAHEFLSRQHHRFGYVSNRLGEIDFVLPGKWAREVKWSHVATNLSKSYLNLNLLDKKVWIKNNFLT